jgi:hypothetical protein
MQPLKSKLKMEKLSTLTLGLVVLLLLSNCESGIQDEKEEFVLSFPVKIDMEEVVNQPITQLNLSMVADSLEYIQLETHSESLIDNIFGVVLTEEFIFLRTSGRILKFSRDGKYLSQIGSQGRGPGEYPGLRNISIDNDKERIFIYPNYIREIIVYDFNNNYQGNISLFGSYYDLAREVSYLGNNYFIASGVWTILGDFSFSEDMFVVALVDSTGRIIKKIDSPLIQATDYINNENLNNPGTYPPSYFDSIALSLGLSGSDTIYAVSHKGIEPRYILDFGRYNAPFEIKYGYSRDQNERGRIMEKRYGYLWIMGMPLETRDYLFLQFSFNDYLYLAAYSKQSGQSLVFREKGTVHSGLVFNTDSFGFKNDLDGGLHFYPRWTNLNSNVWITSYNAFELMSGLDQTRNRDPENLKNNERLIQLIETLDENANPVLVVAHLK